MATLVSWAKQVNKPLPLLGRQVEVPEVKPDPGEGISEIEVLTVVLSGVSLGMVPDKGIPPEDGREVLVLLLDLLLGPQLIIEWISELLLLVLEHADVLLPLILEWLYLEEVPGLLLVQE